MAYFKDLATATPAASALAGTEVLPVIQSGVTKNVSAQSIADLALIYHSAARSIAAPNATVPVHSLQAFGTETNIDFALRPKGSGALTARVADNLAAGGNKRGANAVDWQGSRSTAVQVASGAQSTIGGGQSNRAPGQGATVPGGDSNEASGLYSFASGGSCKASSDYTIAMGYLSSASGQYATAIGNNCTAGGHSAGAMGSASSAGGTSSFAMGQSCTAPAQYSFVSGYYGQASSNETGWNCRVFSSGRFSVTGDAQLVEKVLRRITTDATTLRLNIDGDGTAGGERNLNVRATSGATVRLLVIGYEPATGDSAHFWINVGVSKFGTAATVIVGTPASTKSASTAADTWTAVPVIGDNGLSVDVTGQAAKTIRWVATVEACAVLGN